MKVKRLKKICWYGCRLYWRSFSDETIKQKLAEDIDKVDALIEQWQSVVQENKLELLIDKQKETFTVNEGIIKS